MAIVFTSISFFVLIAGLLIYFFCVKAFSKETILPIAKTMVFCGLLALLLATGAQSCSASAGGGAATSAPAKR
jgi:uncharacterized membrane protein YphA (DoxX/SURF4 family)